MIEWLVRELSSGVHIGCEIILLNRNLYLHYE